MQVKNAVPSNCQLHRGTQDDVARQRLPLFKNSEPPTMWVGPQKLKICYSQTTLRLRTERGASPGRCAVGSWPDRARRRARVSGGTVRGRGVRPGGEGRLWKECVRQLVTSVGDRGRLILPGHPSKGCIEGATKRSPRGAKKLNPKLHASLAGGVP